MSPTVARASSRTSASRRRSAAIRRRRAVLAIGLLALLGVAVFLAMPLFRKTIDEFTLPLSDQNIIRQQAAEKHLDPALIAAVIYAETKFDPRDSPAGAMGLMQLLPETGEFIARRSGATTFKVSDLTNPAINIAYGSWLLRYLLDHFHGNKVYSLAAYNGGLTNADRWVAAARAQGHGLTIAEIPFPETRDYVQRVLQAQQDYRSTYPSQLGYT
jgi:soluble lytic murein transglycosylase